MTVPLSSNPLWRVRVASRREVSLDVCSVELVAEDGATLQPFAAGAHVDVHLPGAIVRQYSLCSDPADSSRYQLAVLKDPSSRGGSDAMHALRVGDVLSISAPRNLFPLAPDASHSLLLAGGIGVTPLLAMARTLHRAGASFAMHYCARTPARTAFLEQLQRSPFAAQVCFHFDDGPEAQRFRSGDVIRAPRPGEHLYVCGPAGFIDHVLAAASGAGWPEERVHSERFRIDAPESSEGDSAFEVEVATTGQVIPVGPTQSITQALAAHGVDVPTECEAGVCGTCVLRVLHGTPDHRDSFLTQSERAGDLMTPCVTRAKSRKLVLDL